MFKLSIITVNLNNAPGLYRTIESVIIQTFANFEYIIIDGGSSDSSVDVIKKFSDKIAYWVSEPDTGIYNAMNKGILQAKGEYSLFLNSGDFLYKNDVLSKVFLNQYDADIIYGDLFCTDNKYKTYISKSIPEISLKSFISKGIPHPAAFIKTSIFRSYGSYNESYKIAADFDFFLKTLVINKVSYTYVPEIISIFNLSGISNINKSLSSAEVSEILYESYPQEIAEIITGYIKLKNFYKTIQGNRLVLLFMSLSRNRLITKISNKLLKTIVKPLSD